ncbi:MAG: protein phosphatase 2C domain-containing protein [Deltaproteobacteria bacterium]|nr:protein phosphatase 2C domain-containing protein [Deltaproteobacteria bacterium]
MLHAAKERNNNGMGATLTAVLVQDGDAWIAEVGDSRAYLLRGGLLRQVTRDQSLVQMLVDGGAMTPAEAKISTRKNIILQAMGKADPVKVAIGRLALRRGDRLLLCSDGVSNAIPDGEMAVIVRDGGAQPACARLISLANERGGEDNSTAVIAHFDGKGLTGAPRGESVTSTFAVLQAFDERSPRRPATGQVPTVPAPAPPPRARGRGRTLAILVALALVAIAVGLIAGLR